MINLSSRTHTSNVLLANGHVVTGMLWRFHPARIKDNFLYAHCYCLTLDTIVAACVGSGPASLLTWMSRSSIVLPREAAPNEMRLMLWDHHGFPHPACHTRPEHRIVQVGGSLLSIPSPRHSTLQRLKITADPARADRAPSPRVYTSKKKISSSP